MDAQKQLLEQTWGGRIVDLRTAAQEADQADPAAPPDARLRVPITSSDVNGDGREDVILFDIGLDENGFRIDAGVTALDGISGRQLWSNNYGNPYNILVLSPRDVTGDGADDLFVIVVDLDIEDNDPIPGGGPGRPYDSLYRYGWDLSLLSGASGTNTWERSIDGSVRYQGVFAGQGPGFVEVAHITGENSLVDVRRSDDLDGDGLSDFTLNVHDYEREFIYSTWVQETDRYVYSTDAEALAGDTGTVLLTRSQTDHPGAAFLLPLGEATGDARADLLWTVPTESSTPTVCPQVESCIEQQSVELHLELVDMTTESGWEYDMADQGVTVAEPVMTGSDLTGDGRADILLGLTLEDGSQRVLAISGASGQRAWTFDTLISDPPTAIGSIDGGSGSDLLFWEGHDVLEQEAPIWFRVRLRRVDGTTGQELFSTQRELIDRETNIDSIFAFPAGDVDADGSPDIAHATWHSDGYWEAEGSASSIVQVESGASGALLLDKELDRNALLFPGGDLSPGGPDDLLEGSVPYNNTNFRLAAIEMPTGETLWSHFDVLLTALFGSVTDRAGGGDDVVYARTQVIQEAPKRLSRIDLLRGSTGSAVWGVGPPLISST
jgi:hypothetical protein